MKDSDIIHMLKEGGLRRDSKGRAYYFVPTSIRRNGRKIVPETKIKRLLKEGLITEEDIQTIMPY